MENVTDALHMVFGVLIFVLALSLAISSFSLVRIVATNIMDNLDKETQYNYLYGTASDGSLETNRIVGKETIIPTLYRAFIENFTVRFYKNDGSPMNIMKIKDSSGNYIPTNEIDLQNGGIGTHDQAKAFISALVSDNETAFDTLLTNGHKKGMYVNFQHLPGNNFYDIINSSKFKETLGIYYLEDLKPNLTEDINKTEKRVITYTLYP